MDRRITPRLIAVSLIVGLGLAAFPVMAGDGSWDVTGSPAGGDIYQVLLNPVTPSILYAGSGPGVFQSTDSGLTWTLVFPTLNPPDVLVMDPLDPQTLYTAYSGDSTKTLFKTTDGGATWTESDAGIGTVENGTSTDWISNIALDPVHEGVLYASSGNTGMYTSTNGGNSWKAINTGLSQIIFPESSIEQVVVDPANTSIVYLVDIVRTSPGSTVDTSVAGLYKSTDGGQHWQTTGLMTESVGRFSIDSADHTHLYSCNVTTLSDSRDSGATWNPAGSCEPGATATDPSNPQHILVGGFGSNLLQSTDGTHFSAITELDGMHFTSIAFDPLIPANVYAGTYSWGLFKSTNGGATWNPSSTGIHDVVVDLMFEGGDGIVYLASDSSGIYTSADQGVTWAQVGTSAGFTGSLPSAGQSVYSLVQDPTANSTLYAATQGGVFKSIDGGDSWTPGSTGAPSSSQTLALALDPEMPSTLYAATNTIPLGAGVYKSINGGVNWTDSGNGLTVSPDGGFQALAVDPHNSAVVYAGAFETGLYKSVDGGATWQPANDGIGVTDIWSVAVDPNDSNTVYTSTSNGFFKSTDAGATWIESDYGLGGYWDMTSIQFDPSDSSIIYVTQRYGIGDAYVSPDAGYTWFDMSTLTPTGVSVATKAVKHKSSRSTMSLVPGHRETTDLAMGMGGVSIRAAVIGPGSTRMLGGANDGQVYSFDVKDLPKGYPHTTTGGGTGGGGSGSGSGGSAASGSGGGSFGLLLILGLAGFAALRRR